MAKFVRNPDGAVHSVPDDFTAPEGWEDGVEGDASPQLLGKESDPEVDAQALRDGPPVVIDESGEPDGPGQVDDRESNDIPREGATRVGATSDNPDGENLGPNTTNPEAQA